MIVVAQAANVGAAASVASPQTPGWTPAALPVTPQAAAPSNAAAQGAASSTARTIANKIAHGIARVFYHIGRGLTLGGRAAYADLFSPDEIARGLVITVDRRSRPALIEPGFIIWLVAWIMFGLIRLLPDWWSIAAFILMYVILLALALPGWRFLGMSRLSVDTLFQFARTFKRGAQPHSQFTLQTPQGHVAVTVRGALRGTMQSVAAGQTKRVPFNDAGTMLAVNHLVRVWGMYEGNLLRAWQIEFLELNGAPASVWLRAPRVLPLTAALLIPLTFWFGVSIFLTLVNNQ